MKALEHTTAVSIGAAVIERSEGTEKHAFSRGVAKEVP
jgi:hypothetical protein